MQLERRRRSWLLCGTIGGSWGGSRRRTRPNGRRLRRPPVRRRTGTDGDGRKGRGGGTWEFVRAWEGGVTGRYLPTADHFLAAAVSPGPLGGLNLKGKGPWASKLALLPAPATPNIIPPLFCNQASKQKKGKGKRKGSNKYLLFLFLLLLLLLLQASDQASD